MNLWEKAKQFEQEKSDEMEYGDMTPKEIAEAIFKEMPKEAKELGISLDKNSDCITIFEILATITLEGLNIMAKYKLDEFDFNMFTKKTITALNPWMQSIQFNIICTEHKKENIEEYSDNYCRVLIKNKETIPIFAIKKIDTPYHFIINGSNYDENMSKNNFEDVSMVFYNNNKVYRISYEFIRI